ncbi:MAG: leucyl/phenylalanyl-tRNA--protein transferase [Myxococcota bacterium]
MADTPAERSELSDLDATAQAVTPERRFAATYPFPDPGQADPEGLLAYGGDLAPERLLAAYESGVFPWYESGPILWFSPDPRTVLRPAALRINRSLRRALRKGGFEIRFDTAFDRVIRACAETPRPGQTGTWITPEMIEAYCQLHVLGYAHSAEAWRDGVLAGGIYGVSLGAAFFGESMFAWSDDASKVAFVHLARLLSKWNVDFIDCQVHSEHLARLGAEPWPRARFLAALEVALTRPTRNGPWTGLG